MQKKDLQKELRECPFCGNEGKVKHERFTSIEDCEVDSVMCEKCGIYFETYTRDDVSADVLWNRRPAEDALKAEVERLKAEIEQLKRLVVERRNTVLQKIKGREVGSLANEYGTLNMLIEALNGKGDYEND